MLYRQAVLSTVVSRNHFLSASHVITDSSSSRKKISSGFSRMSTELEIAVPWGQISVQQWGPGDGDAWVALHGWMDNSGSFDTLAPLFAQRQHRVLAMDYPGHGRSSELPKGMMYHYMEGLQYVRRLAQHFNLTRFNLIGHSMGAGLAMLFAATHPEMVNRLIMLDTVKPISRPVDTVVDRTRSSINEYFSVMEKLRHSQPVVYSYESAVQRLTEGMNQLHGNDVVTRNSVEILLKRGLKPVGDADSDQFVFSRDLRFRILSLYSYSGDPLEQFGRRLRCPHLIVNAENSVHYEDQKEIDKFVSIYRECNPDKFELVSVPGSHHVHLNEAAVVWRCIEAFLNKFPE